MNALARREYTRKELETRLSPRFPQDKKLLLAVLEQLADEGLQSDRRFVENYIRWRAAKGYGPNRIAMEIAQKGVDDDLAGEAMDACGIDWSQQLLQQFGKKYDGQKPASLEEKAKMLRFFQYRGFPLALINTLFKNL